MSDIIGRRPQHATISKASTPPDINITRERAGTVHRQAAIRHVKAQWHDGFIDGDEAGRREAFIGAATTKEQIAAALEDLQPLPRPRVNWASPYVYSPVLCALMAVFVTIGTIGGLIIGVAEPNPSVGAYLLGIPVLTASFLGAAITFVILCVKLNDA